MAFQLKKKLMLWAIFIAIVILVFGVFYSCSSCKVTEGFEENTSMNKLEEVDKEVTQEKEDTQASAFAEELKKVLDSPDTEEGDDEEDDTEETSTTEQFESTPSSKTAEQRKKEHEDKKKAKQKEKEDKEAEKCKKREKEGKKCKPKKKKHPEKKTKKEGFLNDDEQELFEQITQNLISGQELEKLIRAGVLTEQMIERFLNQIDINNNVDGVNPEVEGFCAGTSCWANI